MNRIACIIFDMDGVIVNTEPLHKKAFFEVFASLGIEVSKELYHSLIGSSTINFCQKLVAHFQLDIHPEEIVLRKRAVFADLFQNDPSLRLLDGVEDLIRYLHEKEIVLVLASSSSMETIQRVFTRFHLDSYFLAKISGAELQESKPHPEIFEKAARIANIPKENCLVIEDSDNGITAANRAHIYCVGYKSKYSEQQTLQTADLVIEDFNELKERIEAQIS